MGVRPEAVGEAVREAARPEPVTVIVALSVTVTLNLAVARALVVLVLVLVTRYVRVPVTLAVLLAVLVVMTLVRVGVGTHPGTSSMAVGGRVVRPRPGPRAGAGGFLARTVDMPRAAAHHVRMSARTHLSSAQDAHPRPPGDSDTYARAAEVLALLGDRTRLILLKRLAGGEADVSTLTRASGAARPAVSQHLARLRLAGVVSTRKDGRRVVYSLPEGPVRRVVDEALRLTDR